MVNISNKIKKIIVLFLQLATSAVEWQKFVSKSF